MLGAITQLNTCPPVSVGDRMVFSPNWSQLFYVMAWLHPTVNNTCPQVAFFFEVFPSARDLVQHKCLDGSDATYRTPKSCFSSSPDHAHNSSPPAHYLVHTFGCASGCYHYSKIALATLITPSLTNKYVFTPTLQCLVEEAQTMLPYPIYKQYVFLLSSMETW